MLRHSTMPHSARLTSWTFQLSLLVLIVGLLSPVTRPLAEEETFPERARFYMVKWISTDDLHAKEDKLELVDVRSKYEYETLHIRSAHNIVFGTPNFLSDIKKLRGESKKPIVFYCNGQTCRKSYEAALAVQNAGVNDVIAYDAGILDWAKRFPEHSVLLGESPMPASKFITEEQLLAHILSPRAFELQIDKSTAIVLDVRDDFQQDGISLFPFIQHSVPLDNKALQRYINQAISEKKKLLIYDATGHQVRWLQYYLESQNVPSYYFMEGGARAFYDSILPADAKKK